MNSPVSLALAQMEVLPGQVQRNLATASQWVRQAVEQGAHVIVFPELCLSGYMVGDLWNVPGFVEDCLAAGEQLLQLSDRITIIFGNVGKDASALGEDGRVRLYNAAWIAHQKQWIENTAIQLPFYPKTLLPNYREFEESRHFYDLRKLARERKVRLERILRPVRVNLPVCSVRIGITLCEDGWGSDYGFEPVRHLAAQGADLILNLSASPYTRGKNGKRNRVFAAHAEATGVPIAYVNCVGMQNNAKTFFGFDGGTTIYHASGKPPHAQEIAHAWKQELLLARFEGTERQDLVVPSAAVLQSYEAAVPSDSGEFLSEDFNCLVQVTRRYLQQSGIERVVVGASGGIDSAVNLALFTHLCGPQNVLAVSMPSRFNSSTTRQLGKELAQNLGCWYAEIPIQPSVDLTCEQMQGLTLERMDVRYRAKESMTLSLSAFHLENVQARDRSSRILAACASGFGGVFSCNANKAETTVGYSTLYGDHGGFLATLADLWKHEIYALGHYLNDQVFHWDVIPPGIFSIQPTAELSEQQNPEQGGGDPLHYEYHDRLFQSWMQDWNRKSPEDLLIAYQNGTLHALLHLPSDLKLQRLFPSAHDFVSDLERWWNLFQGMGVVKRVQAPPVVALSRRAYGYDFRETITPPWYSAQYEALKADLLGTAESGFAE